MKYLQYIKYFILALSLFWINAVIEPQSYKQFWEFAWRLLIIILFTRPLMNIFPKCKIFKYAVLLRREIWILMWIFVIAHGVWYFISHNLPLSDIYSLRLWDLSWYLWWWMLAGLLTIILTITSNNFSNRLLWKNWKNIQRLSYPMFLFAAIHIAMIHNWQLLYSVLITVISYVLVFWLAIYYKRIK